MFASGESISFPLVAVLLLFVVVIIWLPSFIQFSWNVRFTYGGAEVKATTLHSKHVGRFEYRTCWTLTPILLLNSTILNPRNCKAPNEKTEKFEEGEKVEWESRMDDDDDDDDDKWPLSIFRGPNTVFFPPFAHYTSLDPGDGTPNCWKRKYQRTHQHPRAVEREPLKENTGVSSLLQFFIFFKYFLSCFSSQFLFFIVFKRTAIFQTSSGPGQVPAAPLSIIIAFYSTDTRPTLFYFLDVVL